MTNFQIDIVSDTVCPWCFIGQRRLRRAQNLYQSAHPGSASSFAITWHAYQLNPNFPVRSSIDKQEYLNSKYGAANTGQMQKRLAGIGKTVEIDFRHGGRIGNSRDSHRVVALAKNREGGLESNKGLQDRVMEQIFKAYFEEEKDITQHEVLVEAAVEGGLEEEEVKRWIEGGDGDEEVDREIKAAAAEAVTGVPTFTLQGKYRFSGAPEAEELVKLFEKIEAETQAGAA